MIGTARNILLSACLTAIFAAPGHAADDTGMLAFNNHCRECHSYLKDDNRLGPTLFGVVGRKAGTVSNFGNYSSSMKSSGITWSPELLDKWIANPNSVVPGNNMSPPFSGVADEGQRKAIISFLEHDNLPKPKAQ